MLALKKQAAFALVPEVKTSQFNVTFDEIQDMEKQCKTILSKQAGAAAKVKRLEPLTFTNNDVTEKTKAANKVVDNMEQLMQLLGAK